MDQPDIVIVGGGIVGAACARSLALRNVSVLLIDSGAEAGIATGAAAGILAPLVQSQPEDPILALSVRARDVYHELAPALEEETGISIGLWTEGILNLAFTEQEVQQLKGAIAWHRQLGFQSEWLSDEDFRELCPGVSPEAIGALLAPEDGGLDPASLHSALLKSTEQNGGRILRGSRVEGLVTEDGRATGVRTATGSFSTAAVVIAAGCWSGRIQGLPRPLSVEPFRGQMVALDWPADEPSAIVYTGSRYVLRRGEEALAGTTVEYAGFDASVTDVGVAGILEAARRVYPALADVPLRRTWAGLRPITPDGRPILGRDPEVGALWYATGHGRNGILMAGFTGELIAQMFLEEPVDYDLSPMDPGRLWKSH